MLDALGIVAMILVGVFFIRREAWRQGRSNRSNLPENSQNIHKTKRKAAAPPPAGRMKAAGKNDAESPP